MSWHIWWVFALASLLACQSRMSSHASNPGDVGNPGDSGADDSPARIYLPPEQAAGVRFCLDPDSPALRAWIKRGDKVAADTPISRTALARDIPALHHFMRKQYAGYPELVQHREFDIDEFFARWRADIASESGDIEFRHGVLAYLLALGRVHMDRHLQPMGWGFEMSQRPEMQVAEYQAAGAAVVEVLGPAPGPGDSADADSAASDDKLARCHVDPELRVFHHSLRRSEVLRADGSVEPVVTISVQGASAATIALHCDGQTVQLERRPALAFPDSRELPVYSWRSHGDVAVIEVRRLHGSPEERETLAAIAEDYDDHRRHGTVIFDLRGNGGGDDSYVFEWVEKAKRGMWTSAASVEIAGALGPCREWNHKLFQQIAHGVVDTDEARSEREELRAGWPVQSPPSAHEFSSGLIDSEAENPYGGRVIALVDRYSASSAESSAHALRSALGAILVGERTGGYIEYGNIQPFWLPRTGLPLWIPTKRYFHDPPAEGVGLPVDVYLDAGLMRKDAHELLAHVAKLP